MPSLWWRLLYWMCWPFELTVRTGDQVGGHHQLVLSVLCHWNQANLWGGRQLLTQTKSQPCQWHYSNYKWKRNGSNYIRELFKFEDCVPLISGRLEMQLNVAWLKLVTNGHYHRFRSWKTAERLSRQLKFKRPTFVASRVTLQRTPGQLNGVKSKWDDIQHPDTIKFKFNSHVLISE